MADRNQRNVWIIIPKPVSWKTQKSDIFYCECEIVPFLTLVSGNTLTFSLTKCVAGFLSPTDGRSTAPTGESKRSRFNTSSRIPVERQYIKQQ